MEYVGFMLIILELSAKRLPNTISSMPDADTVGALTGEIGVLA
jgi:hypothetical protein